LKYREASLLYFQNTDSLSTNSLSDKQTRKKTNSCPNMQKKPKVITYVLKQFQCTIIFRTNCVMSLILLED